MKSEALEIFVRALVSLFVILAVPLTAPASIPSVDVTSGACYGPEGTMGLGVTLRSGTENNVTDVYVALFSVSTGNLYSLGDLSTPRTLETIQPLLRSWNIPSSGDAPLFLNVPMQSISQHGSGNYMWCIVFSSPGSGLLGGLINADCTEFAVSNDHDATCCEEGQWYLTEETTLIGGMPGYFDMALTLGGTIPFRIRPDPGGPSGDLEGAGESWLEMNQAMAPPMSCSMHGNAHYENRITGDATPTTFVVNLEGTVGPGDMEITSSCGGTSAGPVTSTSGGNALTLPREPGYHECFHVTRGSQSFVLDGYSCITLTCK